MPRKTGKAKTVTPPEFPYSVNRLTHNGGCMHRFYNFDTKTWQSSKCTCNSERDLSPESLELYNSGQLQFCRNGVQVSYIPAPAPSPSINSFSDMNDMFAILLMEKAQCPDASEYDKRLGRFAAIARLKFNPS